MQKLLLVPVLTVFALPAVPGAAADRRVDFSREVRPILSDNCFKCHGPDEKERQAGLRLDREDGANVALESGARAVVPGDLAASELVRRITSDDPAVRMPPPESGKTLTPAKIEALTQWVSQGAEWKQHWSFVTPVRPTVPAVAHADRVGNPIDAFILARLEAERVEPSPAADKVTLLRRVTLDLTGLPPTPAEVDAFLSDASPSSYETVVNRLLKSPRYGEHMARVWLDLARYGDTHGLHLDNERALWKYRDWVIDAFNGNKPFDQFTVEQLAGDLLPNATLDQRIGTGFVRCNVTTGEGGSINEEVLVRYAVDRTETMSTVFLGLTLGCAVCHDHKFDPVSQKEFYQLFAFYNAAADAAMDGNTLGPPPILKVPSQGDESQLADFDRRIAEQRQRIADALARVEYTEPEPVDEPPSVEPYEYVWIEDDAPKGAQLQGNSAWEFVGQPDHPVFKGEKSTRRQAQGLSQHFFTGASPGLKIGEGDKLFTYVWLDAANPPKTIMLQFNDGAWEHRAYWGEDLIPFGAGKENHFAMGLLPKAGEWVRLEVDASAVGLKPGAVLNGWAFTQHDGVCYWDHSGSITRTPQDGQSFKSLAKWEAYEKTLAQSPAPQPVRDAVKVDPGQRTPEQQKQVRDYFLERVYEGTRETFDPLHKELDALNKQRTDYDNAIPITMVMADMPQPRDTHILSRGEYSKPGEKVDPGVPSIFPPMPEGAPRNRLGLAQWLVQPSHPLTARVAVNRLWQQVFGRGLVKTAEDFGAQGEWPSHPELLDWLAVEFIESGWNIQGLMKLMVMSNTYRQSARVTPEHLAADPENKLLARGPRFRLDAETVRDSALFVSGLLVEQVGGKSVRIYQPEGIWEAVGFVGSNTREYKRDAGQALYRRSMYTFWKRTAPHPSMMAFDAPSRETCVARRARTNTPLQALVLMNDEQYVEAARHLARRMLTEGGATPAERLSYGFRLATARVPGERELSVLTRLLEGHLAHYRAQPEAAAKLLGVGESQRPDQLDPAEHAAYAMLGNLVLNLDEAITKE